MPTSHLFARLVHAALWLIGLAFYLILNPQGEMAFQYGMLLIHIGGILTISITVIEIYHEDTAWSERRELLLAAIFVYGGFVLLAATLPAITTAISLVLIGKHIRFTQLAWRRRRLLVDAEAQAAAYTAPSF